MYKIWVDDVRLAPNDDYMRFMTTTGAIDFIQVHREEIEELNLDHDAGECAIYGGDYINILKWMELNEELTGFKFDCIIKLHTMNPVARDNMMRIIRKRGWKYEF